MTKKYKYENQDYEVSITDNGLSVSREGVDLEIVPDQVSGYFMVVDPVSKNRLGSKEEVENSVKDACHRINTKLVIKAGYHANREGGKSQLQDFYNNLS